jgi:ATP-dependent DNA helicase RecG
MNLNSKVSQLNRVGKTVSKQLKRLGIESVKDLLLYYPFRYEDYSNIVKISDLKIGDKVTVFGRIDIIDNRRNPRSKRVVTDAVLSDDSGKVRIIWFGQPFITKNLKVGDMVYMSGKIGRDRIGINMASPSFEKPRGGNTTHTARIVPIYPLTSGITQKQLRFLVSQVIDFADYIKDWLPEELREKADIMDINEAVRIIHFPEYESDLKHAKRRLKFDELFILQLRAEMIRQSLKRQTSPKIEFKKDGVRDFVSSLPFELTDAQKISTWEILKDMDRVEPMNRLLQGDVGAGKTVVAAITVNNAVLNNFQVILMAPTEVLATQHFESFVELFEKTEIKIALYTRSKAEVNYKCAINSYKTLNKKKKYIAEKIKNCDISIVIGTHALLSENVEFSNLGYVIVDEQQRFGVEQRKTIREKSGNHKTMPHFLSMTATPIPRSFALTVYGDLAMSVIRGLPPGRKPIKTRLVEQINREKAYEFIRNQVKSGRQVFVVCPLVDDEGISEVDKNSDKKSVLSEYEKLRKVVFPDLKIGYLYGKLKPEEKDDTMKKFANREIDILVSTSVIEVGVNIPNATVMMIEDAERFGLAQLHQFRGRVGRSCHQSYCFLFTDNDSKKALDRLNFFEKNNDGFKLAEFDLSQRGPGEVYGTAQSGLLNFRFASMQDVDLIKLSRELSNDIDFEKYNSLKLKVKEWESGVHLE